MSSNASQVNLMRHCLLAAVLALPLVLNGCASIPETGAINDTAYQQKSIQKAQNVGTYLPTEELEKLEVPDDFPSKEQFADLLVPQEKGASAAALEMLDLMSQSRYSTAIQWFESRYEPLSVDFFILETYCNALGQAGRMKDAFTCYTIMEKRLYHFVQSGEAEKFTATQKAISATEFVPVIGAVAKMSAEYESRPPMWLSSISFKSRYYLAIHDFENAKKYARKLVALGKVWEDSWGDSLWLSILPTGGLMHFTGEDILGKALAHGNEEDRKEALAIANRMATGEYYNKLGAISVFFALKEYHRANEVNASLGEGPNPGRRATQIMVALQALTAVVDPVGATIGITGTVMSQAMIEAEYESEAYKVFQRISDDFREYKMAYETGDVRKARKGYNALLKIPLILEWKDILSTIYHDLAKLEIQAGNDGKAMEHLYSAIDVIEACRANFTLETERIGFVADKQSFYVDLMAVLTRQGRFAQAWEVAERAKARTLVELLARQERFASPQANSRLEEYLTELNRVEWGGLDLAYYRTLMAEPKSTLVRPASRSKVLARLAEEIRHVDSVTAPLVTVIPLNVKQLQQHLDPNETLVEYFGVGERYFIIVTDAERVRVIPIDARGLEADVRAFRTAVQDPTGVRRGLSLTKSASSDMELGAVGRRLSERLWRPIAQFIHGEQVTIVPHGPLHYLPFSALPLDDGRTFIDDYSLRLLPSVSVLTYLSSQPQTGQGALVLGNPDLNNPALDLPYAQQEARVLGQFLQDSRVLLRGEATETAVKRFGGRFARVHLASHGVFDPENPLQSRLLLAGDGENDGTLTVAELYQTRLDVDLVTLSACETGLGKVAGGDDVVGFTRAFLYAGARSVVSSLWKVSDRATGELMQYFYAQLEQHGDKRRALQEAQQKLRQAGYEHPYYWAAFNVIGEVKDVL